ncbi:uncharacterized protein [Aegilops tauschii subsp. strangulata]|nr:uncharacterized protein LOC109766545 [Aegilops tauschii subsp. strangulata]
MGGGAADHGQASAHPRPEPAVPEHRRKKRRARLLPRRHGVQEIPDELVAEIPDELVAEIPDELVEEIFLRRPILADLVRASLACVSFRGLIADRYFLRRLRKLHAPPVLGFLNGYRDFFPVIPPSPFASAASAVALAADFSFSFLPAPARDWKILDVRDGRVLLKRSPSSCHNRPLVVCDPLYRRYLLLPPIPSVEEWVPHSKKKKKKKKVVWVPRKLQCFLKVQEEAAEETSFTVILIAKSGDKHTAFVFSSSTGQWRAGPWTPWTAEFSLAFFSYLRYAYGCFYGVTECTEKLLVLDTRTMEFSVADLPPEARVESVDIAIVEAGEGITGMFVLPHLTSHISYLIRQNNGGSSSQWRLEKTIRLDSCWYSFTNSTGRHLLLFHSGSSSLDKGTFALDIQTFQLEKVFATPGKPMPYVYSNFPPSLLSSPTISSAAS